jgi:hypothetical protein
MTSRRYDRKKTNRETSMTLAFHHEIRLDRASNAAICAEIADRLRIDLALRPERLPQHLVMLIDRLAADQCSTPAHELAP